MGGARWSRNRNFHSRLWRDVNSLLVLSTIDISRMSWGVWSRPVPTNTSRESASLVYPLNRDVVMSDSVSTSLPANGVKKEDQFRKEGFKSFWGDPPIACTYESSR